MTCLLAGSRYVRPLLNIPGLEKLKDLLRQGALLPSKKQSRNAFDTLLDFTTFIRGASDRWVRGTKKVQIAMLARDAEVVTVSKNDE